MRTLWREINLLEREAKDAHIATKMARLCAQGIKGFRDKESTARTPKNSLGKWLGIKKMGFSHNFGLLFHGQIAFPPPSLRILSAHLICASYLRIFSPLPIGEKEEIQVEDKCQKLSCLKLLALETQMRKTEPQCCFFFHSLSVYALPASL